MICDNKYPNLPSNNHIAILNIKVFNIKKFIPTFNTKYSNRTRYYMKREEWNFLYNVYYKFRLKFYEI